MIEDSNKQFKCPCGKTYKSYPALHTHVRRKHNGEAPGNIEIPNNNLTTRRGRPAVEMQKAHPVEERLEELEALTLIELGILRVTELFKDYKTILFGNSEPEYQYPKSHRYLFKQTPKDSTLLGIRQFLLQFCQHFTSQLNQVLFRVFSLFFWYIERETKESAFDISMINRFISDEWKKEAGIRGVAYDSWYSNIIKEIFVVMSKWLFLKGFVNQVLTSSK